MQKKILIIDDEPGLIIMMKRHLEKNNYNVIAASNGADGIKSWEKEKPDLIILDIVMPEMDGYTFIKDSQAREDLNKIPIVIFTSKEDMKDLFAVEGIAGYLIKPFVPEEILKKIRELIGSSDIKKDNESVDE